MGSCRKLSVRKFAWNKQETHQELWDLEVSEGRYLILGRIPKSGLAWLFVAASPDRPTGKPS